MLVQTFKDYVKRVPDERLNLAILEDVSKDLNMAVFSRQNLFLLPQEYPLNDFEERALDGLWQLLTKRSISSTTRPKGHDWLKHAEPYAFVEGWDRIWDIARANGNDRLFWRDAYHWCERTLALAHACACMRFGKEPEFRLGALFGMASSEMMMWRGGVSAVKKDFPTLWDCRTSVSLSKGGGSGMDPSLLEGYNSTPIRKGEVLRLQRLPQYYYEHYAEDSVKQLLKNTTTIDLYAPGHRSAKFNARFVSDVLDKSIPEALGSTLEEQGYIRNRHVGTLLCEDNHNNLVFAFNAYFGIKPYVNASTEMIAALSLFAMDPFALLPESIDLELVQKAESVVDRSRKDLPASGLDVVDLDLLTFANEFERIRFHRGPSQMNEALLQEKARAIFKHMQTYRFLIHDVEGYVAYKTNL